jgi:hypothetical protein
VEKDGNLNGAGVRRAWLLAETQATGGSGAEVRRVRGTGENEDGKEVVEGREGREGAGYDGPSYALAT